MKFAHRVTTTVLNAVPDRLFLSLLFFRVKHEILHLRNPQKYTEKVQWLKLYGTLERYIPYVDKFEVRGFIEKTIGTSYLVPLIGMWECFDDIPRSSLPERFVLKSTNGCGHNFICKDKKTVDWTSLKTDVDAWMAEDFYKQEREPQYKFTPRIIIEEYLEDEFGGLRDYKILCSGGVPALVQVDVDRFSEHKSELYTPDWKKLDHISVASFSEEHVEIAKPDTLPQMLDIAARLASQFPFVRVDLYSVGDRIYFGELTFTPGSGLVRFTPKSADLELGKLIDLSLVQA